MVRPALRVGLSVEFSGRSPSISPRCWPPPIPPIPRIMKNIVTAQVPSAAYSSQPPAFPVENNRTAATQSRPSGRGASCGSTEFASAVLVGGRAADVIGIVRRLIRSVVGT